MTAVAATLSVPGLAHPGPTSRRRLLARAVGEREGTVAAMLAAAAAVAAACAFALGALPLVPAWTAALHAGSGRVLLALVGLLLWLSLGGLAAAAWWTGAFDALRAHRGVQAAAVLCGITLPAALATHLAQGAFAAAAAAPLEAAAAFALPAAVLVALLTAWRRV